MPSKVLRKSTLEKREEKEKSQKKLRGKSKLKKLIHDQDDLFKEELQRLYSLLYTVEITSEIVIPSPTHNISESLTWDSQVDIQSPLNQFDSQIKSLLLQPCPGTDLSRSALTEPATWRTRTVSFETSSQCVKVSTASLKFQNLENILVWSTRTLYWKEILMLR